MTPTRFALSHISTAALILASVALSGCSSNGTLAVQDPLGPTASALGQIATNTGAKTSSVGGVFQAVGSSVATTEMAGIDPGVMTGLGGAVQQVGNAVDVFGSGTGKSFGQTGNQDADILAIKLENTPLIVTEVGGAVSSVGDAVAAIDNGQLTVLSPVTDPAGLLLNQTGAAIASLSGNMSDAMAIPVVQQVTRAGSTMIHMIAVDAEATTQYLGTSTGLGVPVNDLLVGTGLTVKQLGSDISTTFTASPVLASTGAVVSSAGTLVASVGGLVVSPTTTSNTTPSTFGNVIASLSSGPASGSTPSTIGGVLTTVTTPTTVSSVFENLSSGPTSGATPSTIGGALTSVTTPLSGVLSSLR